MVGVEVEVVGGGGCIGFYLGEVGGRGGEG